MLKRNWNERNNRLFCHIFVIGEISIGGEARFNKPTLQLRKTKKSICKFSARFLAFFNKISKVQKIVLSLSRGQGTFRGPKASRPRPRTWGFEAKAKDFKMCPWGLHFWLHHCKDAKQQNIRCIASSLKFLWYGSIYWMEYGRKFQYGLEYMKGRFLVWNGNGI